MKKDLKSAVLYGIITMDYHEAERTKISKMDIFHEALLFGAEAHKNQYRKLTGAPYFLHPMEAAAIVGTMSSDPELLAAALLHDTVEDADVSFEELKIRFGARVAALVASETETRQGNSDAEMIRSWRARKEENLNRLRDADVDVKMLWLGDKLSNMRSFAREYDKRGNSFWNGFHQNDPAVQAWYYRTIADYTAELKDYAAHKEYTALLAFVFGAEADGKEEQS